MLKNSRSTVMTDAAMPRSHDLLLVGIGAVALLANTAAAAGLHAASRTHYLAAARVGEGFEARGRCCIKRPLVANLHCSFSDGGQKF